MFKWLYERFSDNSDRNSDLNIVNRDWPDLIRKEIKDLVILIEKERYQKDSGLWWYFDDSISAFKNTYSGYYVEVTELLDDANVIVVTPYGELHLLPTEKEYIKRYVLSLRKEMRK